MWPGIVFLKHKMFQNLFRKKPAAPIDFSFVHTDMHSHVLPGIDDGAGDVGTAVQLIGSLQELGFRKFIATPHVLSDLYPNTPETIERAWQLLPEQERSLCRYAAEYMVDYSFGDLLQSAPLLGFGKNYVLIEMSYVAASANIRNVIFDLKVKGYQPVLAHPERYGFYHQRYSVYRDFINSGCMLQVNLLSLSGYYGKQIKAVAQQLLDDRLIDFAGTDCHHERHVAALRAMQFSGEMKQLSGYPFRNAEL